MNCVAVAMCWNAANTLTLRVFKLSHRFSEDNCTSEVTYCDTFHVLTLTRVISLFAFTYLLKMINSWPTLAAVCCDDVPATVCFWVDVSVLCLFSHIWNSWHYYVSSSVLSFLKPHNPPSLSRPHFPAETLSIRRNVVSYCMCKDASDQRDMQRRHFGRRRLWPIAVLTRMYLEGLRSHETLSQ
jgi:hypothetical protein